MNSESSTSTSALVRRAENTLEYSVSMSPQSDNTSSLLADISSPDISKSKNSGHSYNSSDDFNVDDLYSPIESRILNDSMTNNDSDKESFIIIFNEKYNSNARSLTEVLEVFEQLLKQRRGVDKSRLVNPRIMEEIKDENSKLKEENDQLRVQLTDNQSKVTKYEYEISTLTSKNTSLNEQVISLEKETKELKIAIAQTHEILESQLNDISVLGTQRSSLIQICNKQISVMGAYEHLLVSKPKINNPQVIVEKPKKQMEPSTIDENYSLLCTIVMSSEDIIKNEASVLKSIRDDSHLTVSDRISEIVKTLSKKVLTLTNSNDSYVRENKELISQRELYYRKCKDVLSMFESQLAFLQKLTHSIDLQKTVLFQEQNGISINFSEDQKSDLIRRCAQLGRFVEDTIGVISKEKFDETFNSYDNVNTLGIFDLINPNNMDNFFSSILEQLSSSSDIDIRQVFDMFCAELYLNSILKNHIIELNLRINHYNHEISVIRQNNGIDESFNHEATFKDLRRMEKRDSRLRKFLSKIIPIDETIPTINLVAMALEMIQDRTSNGRISINPKDELSKLRNDSAQLELQVKKERRMRKKMNDEAMNQIKTFQEQIENIKEQLKKSLNDNESKTKDLLIAQNEIVKKTNEIIEMNNKFDSLTRIHLEEKESMNTKLTQLEAQCQELKVKVSENEQIMNTIKKQRKVLGKKIEKLNTENKQLQDISQSQKEKITEQFSNKLQEERDQNKKLVCDIEEFRSQVVQLSAKVQQLIAENTKLNVEKRTAEMRMKSTDQRINLEQQTIQTKISTQIAASQMEQGNMVNQLKKAISESIQVLRELINDNDDEDIRSISNKVVEEVQKLRKIQYLYIELLEDVNLCQNELGIGPNERVFDSLKSLLVNNETKASEVAQNQKLFQQNKEESERLRREMKRTESQIVQLKQWECWGRRIHRVIHEIESVNLSNDELRLSLEEALLSSVSHRSIFFRIESLRSQKQALLKHDKRLLLSKQNQKYSLRSIMIVCLLSRRIQKIAGCLTFGIIDRSYANNHIASENHNDKPGSHRKRHRSASQKQQKNSPIKQPLFPIRD